MVSSSSSLGVTWQRGRKSGSNSQLHPATNSQFWISPYNNVDFDDVSHLHNDKVILDANGPPSPSRFHDHIDFSKLWSSELTCPRIFSSEYLLVSPCFQTPSEEVIFFQPEPCISHVWRVDSTTRKMIEIQQYLLLKMNFFPATLIPCSLYWLSFPVWFLQSLAPTFFLLFHSLLFHASIFPFPLFSPSTSSLLSLFLLSFFLSCWQASPASPLGMGTILQTRKAIDQKSFLPSLTQSRWFGAEQGFLKGWKKAKFFPGLRNKIAGRKWPWPLPSNLIESLTK